MFRGRDGVWVASPVRGAEPECLEREIGRKLLDPIAAGHALWLNVSASANPAVSQSAGVGLQRGGKPPVLANRGRMPTSIYLLAQVDPGGLPALEEVLRHFMHFDVVHQFLPYSSSSWQRSSNL